MFYIFLIYFDIPFLPISVKSLVHPYKAFSCIYKQFVYNLLISYKHWWTSVDIGGHQCTLVDLINLVNLVNLVNTCSLYPTGKFLFTLSNNRNFVHFIVQPKFCSFTYRQSIW